MTPASVPAADSSGSAAGSGGGTRASGSLPRPGSCRASTLQAPFAPGAPRGAHQAGGDNPPVLALLFVLGSSNDAAYDAAPALWRRLKDAVGTALARESKDASRLMQRMVYRTAHWEPGWSSVRRQSAAVAPPVGRGDDTSRQELYQTLAFIGSYTGLGAGASGKAHWALSQALAALAEQAGPRSPLLILAQGRGALLVEAHFAALQHADPAALPPDWLAASPLQRGETLLSLWTVGSPLHLWLQTRRRLPDSNPWEGRVAAAPCVPAGGSLLSPAALRCGGRFNFWHRADALAYPFAATAAAGGGSAPPAVVVDAEVNLTRPVIAIL